MKEMAYNGFHTVKKFDSEIKGVKKTIESVGIKSAVGALVIDADGKIGLVKQFRPCINETIYEIPAGLMDKEGKTSEDVIIEELYEECDIQKKEIASIDQICKYYMVCGSSDAEMQLYYIRLNTTKESQFVEDDEVEEVVWFTRDEFKILCISGEINDSKTLMCYHYLLSK